MKVFKYKEIDSTQDAAKRLITKGEEDFFVLAENQSLGKGTQGRKWVSVSGHGLYLSVVLCLEKNLYSDSNLTDFCTQITEKAVLELKDALLEHCASKLLGGLYIKPINDLYYDSRKLAGILVEHIVSNDKSFLIIGIGLNLKKIEHDDSFMPISLEEICGFSVNLDKEVFSEKLALKLVNKLLSVQT